MDDVSRAESRAGQLDALRAFAVTAVIFAHAIAQNIELGSYAVYLFFVLSGYLITRQLFTLKTQAAAAGVGRLRLFGVFYARRALRLFPAYYLTLIIASALDVEGMRQELPWHAAHASNLMFALHPDRVEESWAGHFWSLSVEEQFYLFWPLLIVFLPGRWAVWAMGALVLVGAYAWYPNNALPDFVAGLSILDSLDSLCVGALLAALQRGAPQIRSLARPGWLAAAVCLCLGVLQAAWPERWSDAVALPLHETMLLAFAALVFHAAKGIKGWAGAVLNLRPLQYIGRISYAMYLIHLFVNALLWKASDRFGLPYIDYGLKLFVVEFSLSMVLAALSWTFVEAPINRFKPRLKPSAGQTQPAPA